MQTGRAAPPLGAAVDGAGETTKEKIKKGGGRAPTSQDKVDSSETWEAAPTDPAEARLIVLHITDVYTLENFGSFKTLLEETREKSQGATVVCMLTGDFLSPYLLSSVDRGKGMMHALNSLPMDYLTWGNHEADIDHRTGMCAHERVWPRFSVCRVPTGFEYLHRVSLPCKLLDLSQSADTSATSRASGSIRTCSITRRWMPSRSTR